MSKVWTAAGLAVALAATSACFGKSAAQKQQEEAARQMEEAAKKMEEASKSAADGSAKAAEGMAAGMEALAKGLGAAASAANGGKTVEPHLKPALLTRFAHRRVHERFTTVDVSARKHPLPVAGFDRAAHEHQPIAGGADDRAHGDLGIDVEDEAAAAAHETRPIAGAHLALFERVAAPRAEAIRERIIDRTQQCHGAGPLRRPV